MSKRSRSSSRRSSSRSRTRSSRLRKSINVAIPIVERGLEKASKTIYSKTKESMPAVKRGLKTIGSTAYTGIKKATPVVESGAKTALGMAEKAMGNIFRNTKSALQKTRKRR